jgi:hypothetical protein
VTVQELYLGALEGNHRSLILLIEFLVNKKKVIKLTDTQDKLEYFLQDKFGQAMNEHLSEYEKGKGE